MIQKFNLKHSLRNDTDKRGFNKMVLTYEECINGLISVLNSPRDKGNIENFKLYLSILKNDFNKEVSTKFLRNLIEGDKTPRQKTKKISYLLSNSGLKTEREIRNFKEWCFNKYQTEITEYRHDKNTFIYKDFPRGLFNKEMTLINHEALNRRNSINKGFGVAVSNVYNIQVSREFIKHDKEVLRTILI